jgi:dUTP pyrophosphatase
MSEIIYFAKTNSNALIPSKNDENAGYDIYACFENDYVILQPH